MRLESIVFSSGTDDRTVLGVSGAALEDLSRMSSLSAGASTGHEATFAG
jgi:hypothetical protein